MTAFLSPKKVYLNLSCTRNRYFLCTFYVSCTRFVRFLCVSYLSYLKNQLLLCVLFNVLRLKYLRCIWC